MNVGQMVELKRDNENGVGDKGDKGFVLYKLYNPIDGWDVMVKLKGGTEAFLEKDLKIATKVLTKVSF